MRSIRVWGTDLALLEVDSSLCTEGEAKFLFGRPCIDCNYVEVANLCVLDGWGEA
jgi:hypothetical protein